MVPRDHALPQSGDLVGVANDGSVGTCDLQGSMATSRHLRAEETTSSARHRIDPFLPRMPMGVVRPDRDERGLGTDLAVQTSYVPFRGYAAVVDGAPMMGDPKHLCGQLGRGELAPGQERRISTDEYDPVTDLNAQDRRMAVGFFPHSLTCALHVECVRGREKRDRPSGTSGDRPMIPDARMQLPATLAHAPVLTLL